MGKQDVWAELEGLIARVLRENLGGGAMLDDHALEWAPASLADEIVSHFDLQTRALRPRPEVERGEE